MEYEEIKLLKQSEKSEVYLVRERNGEQLFIRKKLKGRHLVYLELQNLTHPYLPRLYEVILSDNSTTVIEEYIEGTTVGSTELSNGQFLDVVRELCSVLKYLHGKGIIHRDIKPSNIIVTEDGHIRLIDFDAARMPKDDLEQDTMLLGTRGYAPPEQYGFSQTDERADIYAMGVTLEQLLGEKARKPRYKKILSKCTNLDPDKRYQSVRQVEIAFSHIKQRSLCVAVIMLLVILIFAWNVVPGRITPGNAQSESENLIVLPSPSNPHWDGETGIALWGNVPESGVSGEVEYDWRLYRCDTPTPPDLDKSEWGAEDSMRGGEIGAREFFNLNLSCELWDNGYYYFAVRSAGDGVTYADSPYVLSDVFEYTGEDAPRLPAPENLSWVLREDPETDTRLYFACFSNFDEYEDKDSIEVYVYDENGAYVMNNVLTKKDILDKNRPGIRVREQFVNEPGKAYRFAIRIISSRPNEYQSTQAVSSWPVGEEYLSPWFQN